MKNQLGDKRTITEIYVEFCCEICDEPATYRLTFLYKNGRNNPASKAYGKDDCSWCSDYEMFVCAIHEKDKYKIEKEKDMVWCSSFSRDKFEHMFCYWQKLKEE